MKEISRNKEQYWASLPADEFINEAHQKIQDFYEDLENTGLYYVIERLYRAYYGAKLTGSEANQCLFDSSELSRGGENGEITNLKVNHFRNLVQHTLQLATSQKAAITCVSNNTDFKSQAQAILGRGVVDYYMTEKKVNRHRSQAIEKGLALTEGWLHCPWNASKGAIYDKHPDTGAPMYQGDLEFSTHTILDVPREINLSEEAEHEWLFVRVSENKWNLIAKNPTLAEKLLNSETGREYEDMRSFRFKVREDNVNDFDHVTKWIFYHRVTDAMPKGRLCMFTGTTLLFDGPIPYREIPLYKFSPQNLLGTPYSYTPAIEILGPQQGVDILSSTIMTNNATNGVQNVWTKRDDNISVTTLSGGMKNLQSDEMPQPVQLTKTAAETFEFRRQLISEMETLIGISATVRGNPEASLKSGNALALVVSQSVQFASLIEEGSNQLLEDAGTAIINQLRDFGKTPRVANIMGESSRPYQKQFTGDDLSEINRVSVEQTNPLSKTVAGCVQLAENLADRGMIKTADQYMMVLSTGKLDPVMEATQTKMLNIRAENEELRNGRPVKAIMTQNHADHVREHSTIIDNPDASKDANFVSNTLAHIQEHIDLWRQADPAILIITGQQPPPPPAMPVPMGRPPQQGGQAGPPPGPQGSNGPMQSNENPMLQNLPGQPNMPSLPAGAPPEAQVAYEKQQMPEAA